MQFISEISQIFSILCSLYALTVGAIYRNRFKELNILYIYPAASLGETIFSTVIVVEIPQLKENGIPTLLVHIFLLIEFIIIYHFYLQVFKQSTIRKILYSIAIFYFSLIICIWLTKKNFVESPEILFVPQAICILFPALYYLIGFLKNPSTIELKDNPRFWVFIGLMLYFGCTLPFFLLFRILDHSRTIEQRMFAINYIFYGIMFLLIIKAYLCKKIEAR
jgi:hypothetical protein